MSHTYCPRRSTARLIVPIFFWVLLTVASTVVHLTESGLGITEFDLDVLWLLIGLWTMFCGWWFVRALLPPRITVDSSGILWQAFGFMGRKIEWSQITDVST